MIWWPYCMGSWCRKANFSFSGVR